MSLAIDQKNSGIPSWMKKDQYWSSTLYILGEMNHPGLDSIRHKFVDIEGTSINFVAIRKATAKWSTGEKILIALAAHLFNSHHKFNLSDLDYLGRDFGQIALQAIRVRYRI